ncbi:MAG: hydrogenase [Oligoflexia bacterium]|nr:hydrogenase [Oligoflexia bacterium]MBF0365175.1 hydrogenase [Oligoflexia bacterium]
MKENDAFIEYRPGESLPLSQIPRMHYYDFYNQASLEIDRQAQVVHYFPLEDGGKKLLLLVLRKKSLHHKLLIGAAYAVNDAISFTVRSKMFHLFEREIMEELNLRLHGHPWPKPLRKEIQNYKLFTLQGSEVHEVGVGPVHAGVIEPGHFRFSAVGEEVKFLEIQLGYQHRGIEKLLPTLSLARMPTLIEGVAGDSAVSLALLFANVIEGLTLGGGEGQGLPKSTADSILRTLALELERSCNHIGDLGALSGDVAFLPAAAYFGRMRGEVLNLLLQLSGNRFGKNLIRPFSYRIPLTKERAVTIIKKIDEVKREVEEVGALLFSTPSVLARFEHIGVLAHTTALKLGVVGVAARASNIDYDVRRDYPYEYYHDINVPVRSLAAGDVLSRARIRYQESIDALIISKNLLNHWISLDERATRAVAVPTLSASSLVISLCEAWRGEMSLAAVTDSKGAIVKIKIKDPSFHNWAGLAYAMRGGEISDFPLCNKSFNLSYCGVDL